MECPEIGLADHVRYVTLFYSLGPLRGYLTGNENLCDVSHDNLLDVSEFCSVIHLTKLYLNRRAMPDELPPHLMHETPRDSPALRPVSDQERVAYDKLFTTIDDHGTNFIQGNIARGVLRLSGLSSDQLRRVWHLSDVDGDGRLSPHEWMLACHLTRLAKEGLDLTAPVNVFDLVPDLILSTSLQVKKQRVENYEKMKLRLMRWKERRKREYTRESSRLEAWKEKLALVQQWDAFGKEAASDQSVASHGDLGQNDADHGDLGCNNLGHGDLSVWLSRETENLQRLEQVVARLKKEHEVIRQETVKVILEEPKFVEDQKRVKHEEESIQTITSRINTRATKEPDPFHQLHELRKDKQYKPSLNVSDHKTGTCPSPFVAGETTACGVFDEIEPHDSLKELVAAFGPAFLSQCGGETDQGRQLTVQNYFIELDPSNEEDPVFESVPGATFWFPSYVPSSPDTAQPLVDLERRLLLLKKQLSELNSHPHMLVFRNPQDYKTAETSEETNVAKARNFRLKLAEKRRHTSSAHVTENETHRRVKEYRKNRHSLNIDQQRVLGETLSCSPYSSSHDSLIAGTTSSSTESLPASLRLENFTLYKPRHTRHTPPLSPFSVSHNATLPLASPLTTDPDVEEELIVSPPQVTEPGVTPVISEIPTSDLLSLDSPDVDTRTTVQDLRTTEIDLLDFSSTQPGSEYTEHIDLLWPESTSLSFRHCPGIEKSLANEISENVEYTDILSNHQVLNAGSRRTDSNSSLIDSHSVGSIEALDSEDIVSPTRVTLHDTSRNNSDLGYYTTSESVFFKASTPEKHKRSDLSLDTDSILSETADCGLLIDLDTDSGKDSPPPPPLPASAPPILPNQSSGTKSNIGPAFAGMEENTGIFTEDCIVPQKHTRNIEYPDDFIVVSNGEADDVTTSGEEHREQLTEMLCSMMENDIEESFPINDTQTPANEPIIISRRRNNGFQSDENNRSSSDSSDSDSESDSDHEKCGSYDVTEPQFTDIIPSSGDEDDEGVQQNLSDDTELELHAAVNKDCMASYDDQSGSISSRLDSSAEDVYIIDEFIIQKNGDNVEFIPVKSTSEKHPKFGHEVEETLIAEGHQDVQNCVPVTNIDEYFTEKGLEARDDEVRTSPVCYTKHPASSDSFVGREFSGVASTSLLERCSVDGDVLNMGLDDVMTPLVGEVRMEHADGAGFDDPRVKTGFDDPRVKTGFDDLPIANSRYDQLADIEFCQDVSGNKAQPDTGASLVDHTSREMTSHADTFMTSGSKQADTTPEVKVVRQQTTTDRVPTAEVDRHYKEGYRRTYDRNIADKFQQPDITYVKSSKVEVYSKNVIQEVETTDTVDRDSIANLDTTRKQWEELFTQNVETVPAPSPGKGLVRHWSVRIPKLEKVAPKNCEVVTMSTDVDASESVIAREIRLTKEREENIKLEHMRLSTELNKIPSATYKGQDGVGAVPVEMLTEELRRDEMPEVDQQIARGMNVPVFNEPTHLQISNASTQDSDMSRSMESIIQREIREQREREQEIIKLRCSADPSRSMSNNNDYIHVERTEATSDPNQIKEVGDYGDKRGVDVKETSTQNKAAVNQRSSEGNDIDRAMKIQELKSHKEVPVKKDGGSLIERELREMKQREHELQKQRHSSHTSVNGDLPHSVVVEEQTNAVAQGLPSAATWQKDVSPFISSTKAKKTSSVESEVSSHSSLRTGSVGSADVLIIETTPHKQTLSAQNETPIEREIRLAEEREHELRQAKGLNVVDGIKSSSPTTKSHPRNVVRSSPSDSYIGTVNSRTRSAKRHATSRLQHEIITEKQREEALRSDGKILTTSEERIEPPALTQFNVDVTNGKSFHIKTSNTPPINATRPRATTSPVSSQPTAPVKRFSGSRATFSYKETLQTAESLIEKELREMREREQELRDRHGVAPSPPISQPLDQTPQSHMPKNSSSLVAQWEQRTKSKS